MSGGWKREVSVTVLGGYAATGSQLYYFPSPFDPLTGVFAPHSRVAVGPSAFGRGGTTETRGAGRWTACPFASRRSPCMR